MSFENRLLKLIRDNPILYDPQHPNNREVQKKRIVWIKIAKTMDSDVDTCKKRWHNLRCTYNKILIKIRTTGGLVNYKRKWQYFDRIAFINKFDVKSQIDDYIEEACSEEDIKPIVKEIKQSTPGYTRHPHPHLQFSFSCQLLELVRENELLYNPEHDDYEELEERNRVWAQIANEMKSDKETCKKRWYSLRATYRKIRVKIHANGGFTNYKKKWRYFDKIAFINEFETIAPLNDYALDDSDRESKQEEIADDKDSAFMYEDELSLYDEIENDSFNDEDKHKVNATTHAFSSICTTADCNKYKQEQQAEVTKNTTELQTASTSGRCSLYLSVLGAKIDEMSAVPERVRFSLEKSITDLVYDVLTKYSSDVVYIEN